MAERIDVYDANLGHLGVMERVRAHEEGQWHKTFHCWVITRVEGGALLFQMRSSQVSSYPGTLDISAAGHLEAGEDIPQGIREVSEELGVSIAMDDLVSLGYRVEVADQPGGQKNREYQAVYLVCLDTPLEDYDPQVEEVAGLLWIGLGDALSLFSGATRSAAMWGVEYDSDSGAWEPIRREVDLEAFLPRTQNYYLTVAIMAERFLEGRFPLAIS